MYMYKNKTLISLSNLAQRITPQNEAKLLRMLKIWKQARYMVKKNCPSML